MLCLSINVNSLHLKLYAKVEIPEQKLTYLNTMEYDMKLHQVKTTIVNCTDVRLKVLKILTSHIRYIWCSQHVCDANNKIQNET